SEVPADGRIGPTVRLASDRRSSGEMAGTRHRLLMGISGAPVPRRPSECRRGLDERWDGTAGHGTAKEGGNGLRRMGGGPRADLEEAASGGEARGYALRLPPARDPCQLGDAAAPGPQDRHCPRDMKPPVRTDGDSVIRCKAPDGRHVRVTIH